MDFANLLTPEALAVFGQVVLIDIVLAGDNAIVVGALAAGLPQEQRKKVILIGIIAALVLRIAFALIATWLLGIVGLVLAGGLLLLWVAWRMWRELRNPPHHENAAHLAQPRTFRAAAIQVAVADLSMSIDNVLAVAGAAREHPEIMVIGLVLSVALMGVAANFIARIIERYKWVAWFGFAVIVFVAGKMIWDGANDVAPFALRLVA
ncbi:YjbE family putative metal transport protein [Glacieibacterium frigidum]|uniref:YjbE family putative metal transport protein n=1 Tax=Glacieibacterium frigidum TaxID=2593303 RepID=A0A552UA37_9SPHN|nr:YjbE family putative metal transport protein [Glacieibacterium frigidum]TRW15059.1 YjbE family putative metal transport protein [Glacieibacterium frigidum]